MPRQVSLLSCQDVFVCRTCLGHNPSVEENLEFKSGEDVLEEVGKFFYVGDMISCYGGASEAVSVRHQDDVFDVVLVNFEHSLHYVLVVDFEQVNVDRDIPSTPFNLVLITILTVYM